MNQNIPENKEDDLYDHAYPEAFDYLMETGGFTVNELRAMKREDVIRIAIQRSKAEEKEDHIEDEDKFRRQKDALFSPQKSIPTASPVAKPVKERLYKSPSAPTEQQLEDDLQSLESAVFNYEQIYGGDNDFSGENEIIVPQNVDGFGLEVGSDDEVDGEGIKKKKKTAKQIMKEYTKKQLTPGPRKYEIPRPELLRNNSSLREKEAFLKVIDAMRLMLI